MSNLIHCDGPDCDQTALCAPDWIRVRQGQMEPVRDFCSRTCLAAWSSGQPRAGGMAQLDGQPCTCHRAQADPHTKAEHRAYPTTTVDGR
jgi:hypothetical protein